MYVTNEHSENCCHSEGAESFAKRRATDENLREDCAFILRSSRGRHPTSQPGFTAAYLHIRDQNCRQGQPSVSHPSQKTRRMGHPAAIPHRSLVSLRQVEAVKQALEAGIGPKRVKP